MTILLCLMLLAQGIPVAPSQSGTVTGVLRTTAGTPAVGIRVAAMAQPESTVEAAAGLAMAGIAQADETGRYRLENIPPGRYYIMAGRVDFPTFYPGALEMKGGAVFAIAPGITLSGIDFTVQDPSFTLGGIPGIGVPVQVHVESGARLPVFAAGGFPVVRLTRTDGFQIEVLLNAALITVPASEAQYRASVENLPEGYAVKSLRSGAVDLSLDLLKTSLVSRSGGIEVVLTAKPDSAPSPTGVRVAGRIKAPQVWPLYISGIPGTLFSDGSFQFRGVPPGRHVVAMRSPNTAASNQFGVSLIVGDQDIDGIELIETPVLPLDVLSPSPRAALEGKTNAVLPLVRLRGRVLSEATRQPIAGGSITIAGLSQVVVPLDNQGRFEIPQLLPGAYKLQVSVFDHFTLNQDVVIDDKDVDLDLSIRPAFRSAVLP